jgi:hypothetical protein
LKSHFKKLLPLRKPLTAKVAKVALRTRREQVKSRFFVALLLRMTNNIVKFRNDEIQNDEIQK